MTANEKTYGFVDFQHTLDLHSDPVLSCGCVERERQKTLVTSDSVKFLATPK